MKTLLIPCAGKSSRFPNMRPKWLLTHPDGKLMVQKAIEKIDLTQFDQVVFTIVREHDRKYGASLILRQALESSLQNMNIKMVVCILEDFTSSPSETIYLTAQKVGLQGLVVVKDSDNVVGLDGVTFKDNSVVGLNINKVKNVSNLPGKSFLIVNEQALLLDIVEKEIVSPLICLGVYIFKDIFYTALKQPAQLVQGVRGNIFASFDGIIIGLGKPHFTEPISCNTLFPHRPKQRFIANQSIHQSQGRG